MVGEEKTAEGEIARNGSSRTEFSDAAFMSAHDHVLVLRRRVKEKRYELSMLEVELNDAERLSATLFRALFDARATIMGNTAP